MRDGSVARPTAGIAGGVGRRSHRLNASQAALMAGTLAPTSSASRTYRDVCDACEVDEAVLGIGVDELHAHLVADVEPLLAALDATLGGGIEGARPSALGRCAGDEPV